MQINCMRSSVPDAMTAALAMQRCYINVNLLSRAHLCINEHRKRSGWLVKSVSR